MTEVVIEMETTDDAGRRPGGTRDRGGGPPDDQGRRELDRARRPRARSFRRARPLRLLRRRSERCATSPCRSSSNEITALIGPSGCGKTTFLRCLNRMNDLIEGARVEGSVRYHGVDLYDAAGRSGRGPPADRHGLPEAEPVPEVDLRQHRVRPEDRRVQGQHGRAGRGVAAQGGAVGRGEGQAQGVRPGALGRAAAAAVHRARDRDAARRDPDGRAVLGARPDRHARRSRT